MIVGNAFSQGWAIPEPGLNAFREYMTPVQAGELGTLRPEFFPPERYDTPFDGRMMVRVLPQRQVGPACRDLSDRYNLNLSILQTQLGCAGVNNGICEVIAAQTGAGDPGTTDDIIRHERGHCNGWPADHRR
jgi:hypothetical protein